MAVDTPARIAILGAGPVGLEAALYARYLGYDVDVYERDDVGANMQAWGSVRMFSPFSMNHSTLGLGAIYAQDEDYQPPADDELLTGAEHCQQYLQPLAATDLIRKCIKRHTTVVSVSRFDFLKGENPGCDSRSESMFHIVSRDAEGTERASAANVVIDTTGVFSNPAWIGPGGAPALGETALREAGAIEYGLPDFTSAETINRYANRRTLLVGSGYSAATNLVALAGLQKEYPQTHITWITRRQQQEGGPLARIPGDRLPQRDTLAETANALCSGNNNIQHLAGTVTLSIAREGEQFQVKTAGANRIEETFDAVIGNAGYRGDRSLYEELQLHECYASGGPIKIAAALLAEEGTGDCLDQTSTGPDTLMNPEPDFYVLGAKSYGRNSNFLISLGLRQIVELFSVIGEREDLDLYKTARNLLP